MSAPDTTLFAPVKSTVVKEPSIIFQNWLLHFGRVATLDIDDFVKDISQFGTILGHELLKMPDKLALRVLLNASISKIGELKSYSKVEYPTLKLKIIPNGAALHYKIFVKMNVFHSKNMLAKYFARFGTVRKVELKYNHRTSISKNFCFVMFDNPSSVKQVLMLKDHYINCNLLKCFECRPYEITSTDLHPAKAESQQSNQLSLYNGLYKQYDGQQYHQTSISFPRYASDILMNYKNQHSLSTQTCEHQSVHPRTLRTPNISLSVVVPVPIIIPHRRYMQETILNAVYSNHLDRDNIRYNLYHSPQNRC